MTAEDAAPPARVLLVTGDLEVAQFALRVLGAGAGFEIMHAADPAQALGNTGAETWDLVIADADLPAVTDRGLLARLRRLDRAMPVVVIVAQSAGESTDEAPCGADEYLRKPLRPGQLIAAATALVRKG